MCQSLFASGKEITTYKELKSVFPRIKEDSEYPNNTPEDSDCLCCVDLEGTAKLNGRKITRLAWGDYLLEPMEQEDVGSD